MKVYGLD
jgi:hypothetical protein